MGNILSFMSGDPSGLKKSTFERFEVECCDHSFFRRGKAFFRVNGDGILQVLKFEPGSSISPFRLCVGLFSMYSELQKQWFTSNGCIPRYEISNLLHMDITDKPTYDIKYTKFGKITPESQLDLLTSRGFYWLDQILTQSQLVSQMCKLDAIRYGKVLWNDLEKFAPYLHAGNREYAAKVIDAILAQHQFADSSNMQILTEPELSRYRLRREAEDLQLHTLKQLAQEGDPIKIQEYLDRNFRSNCQYARFCIKDENT